ncbi:MAG: hypothetical protein GW949_10020 [Spirochaetales bacterium]|nr:hypothetical protein [Spirochaetales bacterium]
MSIVLGLGGVSFLVGRIFAPTLLLEWGPALRGSVSFGFWCFLGGLVFWSSSKFLLLQVAKQGGWSRALRMWIVLGLRTAPALLLLGVILEGLSWAALTAYNPAFGVPRFAWGPEIRQRVATLFLRLDLDMGTRGRDSWILPGAFLQALLLGDRQSLDPRVMVLFRQAGILHILALSGFHLNLLLSGTLPLRKAYDWTLTQLSKHSRMPPLWLTRLVEASGFLVLSTILLVYCTIAVPGPGLFRAALMAIVSLGWGFLKYPGGFWAGYWGSMVVLLLLDPTFLEHWGFILSYLSLGGLVLFSGPIFLALRTIVGDFVARYLSTGLAAVWITTPFFLATTFESEGLIVNGIIAGPLVGWVVTLWAALGFLWLLFQLPLISHLLGYVALGTEKILLGIRVIPPLGGEIFLVGGLWLGLGGLIGGWYLWYGAVREPRLRLPPLSARFPGGPRFLDEEAIRAKLHDQSLRQGKDPRPFAPGFEPSGVGTGSRSGSPYPSLVKDLPAGEGIRN